MSKLAPTIYHRLLDEAYKKARYAGPEVVYGDIDIFELVAPQLRDHFKRRFQTAIRSAYLDGITDGYQGAMRELDSEATEETEAA